MKGPLREVFSDRMELEDYGQCNLIDPSVMRGKVDRVINSDGAKFTETEVAWAWVGVSSLLRVRLIKNNAKIRVV